MPRTGEPGRTVSSRLLELLFAFRPERRALSLADATVRRLPLLSGMRGGAAGV